MRTEKIMTIVFLIGIILWYFILPGASILIMISLSVLGMLYFPAAFYFFCDKVIKRQNLPLSIISGLFLSLIPIGILFKLMYWPGHGRLYLIIGAVAALVLFIISYYLRSKASEELKRYYKNMLLRTGILTGMALLFLLTPTATLIKIQYGEDPEMARLKVLYYTNPDNEQYKKQHDEYMLENSPMYPINDETQTDSLKNGDSL